MLLISGLFCIEKFLRIKIIEDIGVRQMVNGLNGYSNQDIMLQEARRKALAAQQNGYVQQTNESN